MGNVKKIILRVQMEMLRICALPLKEAGENDRKKQKEEKPE
jgi:hypothetical protein